MELKLEALKEHKLEKGQVYSTTTRTSGTAPKGTVKLEPCYYTLRVDMSGVTLAELLEAADSAPMTVASHRWCRAEAERLGSAFKFYEAFGFKKGTPSGDEKLRYEGGLISLTWGQLYPEGRTRATPEVKAERALQEMPADAKRALLERLLREMGQ